MKKKRGRLPRQFFVFTAEEKRAAIVVVLALCLGLATMRYRATHQHAAELSERQQQKKQRADKAARAYARSARAQHDAVAKAADAEQDEE